MAWRCSICSFRLNAQAATRWAPVFALHVRRVVRRFTSPFRRFVSLPSEHTKVRCARRCSRSKMADETSRRRWGASWRRSSSPDRCSCRSQRLPDAGAFAVSMVLRSLPNGPHRSRARASWRPSNSDWATPSGAARARSGWRPTADFPVIPRRRWTAGYVVRRRLYDRLDVARLCGGRARGGRPGGGCRRRRRDEERPTVESLHRQLTPLDELYLQRSYELAARGIGSTSPNPPAGAVVVRDGRVVGEGYHRRAGVPHAEPQALEQAGSNARGATVYVSLEPCRHVGRTPPCTTALIEAGVARVVAGTLDPTDHGGADQLRKAGIEFAVAEDPAARELIEIFAGTMRGSRPYAALKMAMSLDGAIAAARAFKSESAPKPRSGYVRELRTIFDAVMVGAGTIRVDDPRLTVRPPARSPAPVRAYRRLRERCGFRAQPRLCSGRWLFKNDRARTGRSARRPSMELREVADVIDVGPAGASTLDLAPCDGVLARARHLQRALRRRPKTRRESSRVPA